MGAKELPALHKLVQTGGTGAERGRAPSVLFGGNSLDAKELPALHKLVQTGGTGAEWGKAPSVFSLDFFTKLAGTAV